MMVEHGISKGASNVPRRLLGTGSNHEIVFVNLVPWSLTCTWASKSVSNVPIRLLGTGSKQEIVLVNLIPGALHMYMHLF
jgi:hypothetical protein